MKLTKRHFGYLFLVIALIYATVNYWSVAQDVLAKIYGASLPFLTGAGLAYIINIVMSGYEDAMRWLFKRDIPFHRAISMTLSYLTFVIVIFLIFYIVLPDLVSSLRNLTKIDFNGIAKALDDLQENEAVQKFQRNFGIDLDETVNKWLTNYNRQISSTLVGILSGLLSSVTNLASGLVSVFISLVFSIYVLAGKEKLGRQGNMLVHAYLPGIEKQFHYVRQTAHESFHGFFRGQTIEAVILGSLCAAGMMLFKLPFAATIGILVGFTALIPVVGAYIGVSIGAVLIMTQSVPQAIFFVIFVVILQQFEGNLIYPRVVGGSIGLPGMWVIVSISIGVALGGIFGMLIAVPSAATIYKLVRAHVYHKEEQDAPIQNA